jgi:thiosulfate/3-mercaptopyruvate sulfurtransferase
MNTRSIALVAALFSSSVSFAATSFAASPLVDVAWVKAHANDANTVFVDLRSKGAYLAGHVPGAVNSGYKADHWRMKKGQVKGMLPPRAHLQGIIGKLGIDNNTHVVLMHGGYSAAETGIATRVYWTFKVLGHNNISILNGGVNAYLADKSNPVEKKPVMHTAKTFTIKMNNAVLASASDVEAGLKSGATILDSRPTDQHLGINKSGAITRTGTLPGAISVPGRWMTVNDKGTIRSLASLQKIYASRSVPTNKNRIVFCNTGHWASLGWFIDSELLGNKSSKMYDGSMAEWSRLPKQNHPMSVKVQLN